MFCFFPSSLGEVRARSARILRQLLAVAFLLAALFPSFAHAQSLKSQLKPADFKAQALLVIHYHRPDGQYDKWNVWSWPVGAPGKSFELNGQTSFGRYAVVAFPTKPARAGFIVRKGNWEEKDMDMDRLVDINDDITEVWLKSGDEKVYSDPKSIDFSIKIAAAFLDTPDKITLVSTGQLSEEHQNGIFVSDADAPSNRLDIAAVHKWEQATSRGVLYTISLTNPVDPKDIADLQVTVPGLGTRPVFAREVLRGDAYEPLTAQLGYRFNKASAGEATAVTFQTWSPVAKSVELLFYANPTSTLPAQVIPLTRGERGLWSTTVPGDLHGQLYRYRFTSYGKRREVPDIHTFAATADSAFSVVVDLDRLTPPAWATTTVPTLPKPTDEVIYEIHVRDFTIADDTCPPAHRGTFLGLTHLNPAKEGKPSSGLSHLKDLGVTSVHLLPIHDYTAKLGEYNWGYWTALFNVPEGNYSANPKDPTQVILDLRTAITTLHKSGVRVILDVVYNHTSSSGEESPFDQTVPFYYFRTTPEGRLRNDAGVGNSIADERPMVRKYILDSLKFWTTQYKIDGFRFDLLGTHHPETVRAICDELLKIRPDITLYGEPWTGGGPIHFPKGEQKGLRMAVFNDHLRHAIRGDLDGTETGFATGPGGDFTALARGVAGAIDDFTSAPTETVNYASAHDNLTLWDKLVLANPQATDAQRRSMQKLALGIILTSQGIPFIHGGCDFARTKHGNPNSYNAPDEINKFDWDRKAEYLEVHRYVAGLIALRKAHPAFRLSTADEVRQNLHFTSVGAVVSFTLNGKSVGDPWGTIFVAYNGESAPTTILLPEGKWGLVVDNQTVGEKVLREIEKSVMMQPYSLMILISR